MTISGIANARRATHGRPAAGAAAAVWAGVAGAVALALQVLPPLADGAPPVPFALVHLTVALSLVVPAATWMALLCGRYWYDAGEDHPLLPATSSLVFALGLALVRLSGFHLDTHLPAVVDALVTFGGPLELCALAVAEIVLLRRAAVTFRQRAGPERGCRS